MHRHFEDLFDAIDFGVRTVTYAHQIPSRPSPTPTTTIHSRSANVDGKPKSIPVTPTDQVKEFIKDGAVSAKEKAAIDKHPAATGAVLLSEQQRLTKDVIAAQGDDVKRDESGRVELKDGKLVSKAAKPAKPTEHENRVKDLIGDKATSSLDKIDAKITQLEAADSPVGIEGLRAKRSQRAAEEGKVVSVVSDKLALVGTLEATKLKLAAGVSADPKEDFTKLRNEAQPLIEQFNANQGQFYDGNDLVGEDWDASKVDFDQLAKRFADDPDKLKEFAGSQGKADGDLRGKSIEDVNKYLRENAKDEVQIALRYQAADKLAGIFERYNSTRNTIESDTGAIAKVDAEIGYVSGSIESDLAALSAESLDQVERNVSPVAGMIEEVADAEPATEKPKIKEIRPTGETKPAEGTNTAEEASETPSTADPEEASDTPSTADPEETSGTPSTADPEETSGTPSTADPEETSGTPSTSDPEETSGTPSTADPEETSGTPSTSDPEAVEPTRDVTIDYSVPEQSAKVLAQAQEKNLLPPANVTFGEQGQATYSVQRGDSYWRIADMSDGKPADKFDLAHFQKLAESNAQRLRGNSGDVVIHPNERVVIQGRSLSELVTLLGLPATDEVTGGQRPQ